MSLRCYTWWKDGVKRKQSQSALHSTWNGERRTYFLREQKSSISINAEKTKNAPNNVERFKVPTVLMVMFNSVTFSWFALHETLILLSCVFIEMVNCLNTIILKSFLIIVFTSILHLFSRTIIPPTICTTNVFFINRILDPITSDVMNNVTLSTWQYAPNTRN